MSPVAAAGPPHTRTTSVNGGGPVSTMNGFKASGMDDAKGTGRVLPHLDDLTSVTPDVDINSPIRRVLQDAEKMAKGADIALDFRRPDVALQEFIKASIVAMDIIPRHKDYPSLSAGQGELNRMYMGLLKRIKAQQGRFDEAKRIIKEDNDRSGVRPRGHTQSTNGTTATSNGSQNGDYVNGTTLSSVPNGSPNAPATRKKPPIQPKPDALHGKALQPPGTTSSTSDVSELAVRFARLRSPAPNAPVQDPRIRTQPISIPEQSSNTTKSPPTSQPATFSTTLRPLGPREMPSVPTAVPRSTRMPLETQIPGMPKPPDAIYSPSRNPDTAATINFPTSIPRSSSYIGNGNNAAPPVSSAARTPSFDGRREYFTLAHKVNDSSTPRPDTILPNSTTVSVSDLTKYLRMGSQTLRILLVDVRSREEFDDGHIMSPSIICIEPVTLRDGISSEDLVESLVLSPDSEQKLFEQRHEFDLVVFYDQRSLSLKGSSGHIGETPYLQNFAKAMYDYGYDKQLKRRPMLLLGGVDAWTELMGPSSLQSSSTGSSSFKNANGNGIRPARPLGRVPMARDAHRFALGRKRTYESRTLSKEEESKWDETLREHPTNESTAAVEQDELSYVRTTEDFFRRYPELPSIQESMISALPPPKRVAYYSPSVSSIPEPPARPAPALPRQRSSGVLEKAPITTYAMSSGIGTGSADLAQSAGLTGLRNTGVSCYANSIVQCISATGPLRDYLIHFVPGSEKVPRKAGESTDPPQLLVRNLGNLLGHMWSGRYDHVAPNIFLAYINAIHIALMPRKSPKNNAFGGSARQHDASEFLLYILGVLHDENNRRRDQPEYGTQLHNILLEKYPQLKSLSRTEQDNYDHDEAISYQPTEVAMQQEWQRQLTADDSAISRTFYGQETWMIRCTDSDCGFARHRFRSFPLLQLNFPARHILNETKAPVSIMEMFGLVFNVKPTPDSILSGAKCHKCKSEACISDRAVTYMPDYLIIDFQRFSQEWLLPDAAPGQAPVTGKIDALVTFAETMDLTSIFLKMGAGSKGTRLYPGQIGPFIYDCYAVVMHSGGNLQQGHYISMTRSLDHPGHVSQYWHQFNDTVVTKTTFAACQRPNVNVTTVFMKRRQNA